MIGSPIICKDIYLKAIFFIDISGNVWYKHVHWLMETLYLSIIARNAAVNFNLNGVLQDSPHFRK